MTRINGSPTGPRPRPLVEAGGEPVPLPPLEELHGVGMPGGDLHRTATENDAGFMAADHVRRLAVLEEEVAKRPIVDPKDFAKAGHVHPPDVPRHSHPELAEALAGTSVAVEGLRSRIESLAQRPTFDPKAYAKVDHEHPPRPLPKHEHPEIEEVEAKIDADLHLERAARAELAKDVEALKAQVKEMAGTLAFVRDLAERALDTRPKTPDHGTQGGGRLHDSANERLAGFMTPEHLKKLETLWKARTGG